MVRKDLGMVTAYAYAVSKGYTGTEAEFAELMASYASVAEAADASAQAAASSASSAAGSATNASGSASAAAGSASAAASSASTASTKASESATSATAAAGSATTASTKAGEAASSASAAAQSATQAAGSASTAAQSATDANTAKTDAQTAKTAAETAQEKAEEAQAAAEAAAQTLVIDDTLTQANQAAEAKAVGDALKTKAEVDGYYQDMTVGDAEQLVSSQYVEDNAPYKFRTSGGSADVGNREYVDKVVGGTVAWNQMAHELNASYWRTANTTASYSDGVVTFTASERYGRIEPNGNIYRPSIIFGHKYLFMGMFKTAVADSAVTFGLKTGDQYYLGKNGVSTTDWVSIATIKSASATELGQITLQDNSTSGWGEVQGKNIMFIDLTAMFGSTIADAVYAMEQATAGAGVAWFRSLFPDDYYNYNTGELISVSGLQSHDMVDFNQWDEEWEVGGISTDTGNNVTANLIRSKNICKCLPNIQYYFGNNVGFVYWYDADGKYIKYSYGSVTYISPSNANGFRIQIKSAYGTTYKNDICINLFHNGSRNGEYEPYEKHSYPLDSSLILRGIPKLSADNQLYFDGDEYLPDGKVNRRYGVVDLGTLNWTYQSGSGHLYFRANLTNVKRAADGATKANIVCNKYANDTGNNVYNNATDKTIAVPGDADRVMVYDSAYTDAASFKTAMSGVMLVYELATPTEETAEPYNEVQLVDDWGTEEYVSGTICPVGHETRYPANLRDKLQHLPDLASADGYYVVQQTGSQMSLVHFRIPQAPAADGTYALKATVSGGVPTYTWEVVT